MEQRVFVARDLATASASRWAFSGYFLGQEVRFVIDLRFNSPLPPEPTSAGDGISPDDPPVESSTEKEISDWENEGGAVYEIELTRALARITVDH